MGCTLSKQVDASREDSNGSERGMLCYLFLILGSYEKQLLFHLSLTVICCDFRHIDSYHNSEHLHCDPLYQKEDL